jgi:diguanylate cyclase (GGDEF)-like protein
MDKVSQLAMLRDVLDDFPFFICFVHCASDEILYCNKYAVELLGFNAEGRKEREIFPNLVYHAADGSEKICKSAITPGGTRLRVSVINVGFAGGSRALVGIDTAEDVIFAEKLLAGAAIDPMTGIYNRHVGLESLRMYVESHKYSGFLSVCFIDLNDLKPINDSFGHKAGDEFILTVVEVIKNSIRLTDVFARIGGDEFLIIFPNCKAEFAERIMSGVADKLEEVSRALAGGRQYSISYGIQEVSCDTTMDADEVLNAADSRMYLMKDKYRALRKLVKE